MNSLLILLNTIEPDS